MRISVEESWGRERTGIYQLRPRSFFEISSRKYFQIVGDSAPKAVAVGFNPNAIVHCILQPLFAPEVMFRRLYAHVTEQKLDLLDLSTGNGGELEQIQFLLGHVSVQTTELYLGWQAANPGCRERSHRYRADHLIVGGSRSP